MRCVCRTLIRGDSILLYFSLLEKRETERERTKKERKCRALLKTTSATDVYCQRGRWRCTPTRRGRVEDDRKGRVSVRCNATRRSRGQSSERASERDTEKVQHQPRFSLAGSQSRSSSQLSSTRGDEGRDKERYVCVHAISSSRSFALPFVCPFLRARCPFLPAASRTGSPVVISGEIQLRYFAPDLIASERMHLQNERARKRVIPALLAFHLSLRRLCRREQLDDPHSSRRFIRIH